MLFGSLEEAVEKTAGWECVQEDLRALSAFLRDNELKMRFCATCLTSQKERNELLRYVGSLVDWKWEHLSSFLFRLDAALPILVRRFKLAAMMGSKNPDEGIEEIQTAVLRRAYEALRRPCFLLKVQVLRVIA
jgi:hypothetical protein